MLYRPTSSTAGPISAAELASSTDRAPFGGSIDGGWWPRSTALEAELPALLERMFAAGFDVTDVIYNSTRWEPAPCQLTMAGHRIHLHGNAVHDGASIQLTDSTGLKPVVMVVIPPSTEPLVAENALALAGRDGNLHRPDQIMVRAELQAEATHPAVEQAQAAVVAPTPTAPSSQPIGAR